MLSNFCCCERCSRNTITSQDLIHDVFAKRLKNVTTSTVRRTLASLIRIAHSDTALSDIAECERIENDLRPSEVQCLYDDFENGNLMDCVIEEFNQFCMSMFEYVTSKDNKYDFVLFFGKNLEEGEVVGFDIHRDYQDWIEVEFDVIDKYWSECCALAEIH